VINEPASQRIDKANEKTYGAEAAHPEPVDLQPMDLPSSFQAALLPVRSASGTGDDPTDRQARLLADTRFQSSQASGRRRQFVRMLQERYGNNHVQRVLARRPGSLLRPGSNGSLQAAEEAKTGIEEQRGAGQPLSESVRTPLEAAFEQDFSQVRLHTSSEAQELSAGLEARAFTSGRDIWLADPSDANDTGIMAHELAHVVQQAGQPAPDGDSWQVSQPGDPAEEQAESAARMANQTENGENNPQTSEPSLEVPAFQREEKTNAPIKPSLTPEQKVVANQDAENIVTILTAGDPDPEQQAAIIGIMRNYQQMDDDYQNSTGYPGTTYLDYFLVRLKIASVLHSRIWPLESETVNAFDDLWYRLEGSSLEAYRTIVASSQAERTAGPESKDVESFAQTMGKQEAMGMWGMLKGMGQGLAGLSDAGAKALTKAMRGAGVDVSDPASVSDWLGKQYDISGNFMFGEDWEKKDNLGLGMNAADIGTKGGGVIWSLVLIGSGKAASADAKAALVALGVAGNLDAIDKCNTNIANIVRRLQKGGKLNPSDLLSDPDFISESARLAANIFGVISAGAGSADEISKSLQTTLATTGLILDSAQAAALVNKLNAISASNLDPDAKNKASADAVVELIQVSVNIVHSASPEQEAVSGVDENMAGKTVPQSQPAEAQTEASAKPIETEQTAPRNSESEYVAGGPSGLELDISGKPQQAAPVESYGNIPEEQLSVETTPQAAAAEPFGTIPEERLTGETTPHGQQTAGETEFNRQNELSESEMQARARQNAPESERAVGSPGTASFGESESRAGIRLREYDAAEIASELRLRKDYSPEFGGYLRSVEFDVPSQIGNFKTRPKRFEQDEPLNTISVEHPTHQDLTNTNYERGHAAAQQLSGGDPDVAEALMITTNMWPMRGNGPEGINQGQYKEFEDDYIALKAEHPGSEVHIRVEAVVSETPRFITGSAGRKVLAPEAFVITVTFTEPGGSPETYQMRINN
jgi:hypothetical protein